MKLKTAISEFLIAGEADGLSPSTMTWYRSMLKTFLGHVKDRALADIKTKTIRNYIIWAREKYSEDSAHGHIRVQHRFWSWCSAEYSIDNPMRNIKYPQMPKQKMPKAASLSDIGKVLAVMDDEIIDIRDRAIILMLLDTGARVTGLCTLTMDRLNTESRSAIVIEKGRKQRTINYSEETAKALNRWIGIRANVQTVFYSTRSHKPLTRSGVEQMLKRRKKAAGVTGRLNPHSFRHAFGREYLRAGGDLSSLSRSMGHESITTTASYYALFATDESGELHDKFSPVKNLNLDNGSDED